MTRIIAGSARGRRLRAPAGEHTRPTADRVREALFSSLESELGAIAGARFLDLYAGSGAVGLEAWSRGAEAVTLVEQHAGAVAAIRANAAALGARVDVRHDRVERFARSAPQAPAAGAFDVVFADPPYPLESAAVVEVLESLAAAGHLAEGAIAVVERAKRASWEWPDRFERVREKKYGETMLWYGRFASTADEED